MAEVDRRMLLIVTGVGALLAMTMACRSDEARIGQIGTNFALIDVNIVDVRAGEILPHRTIVIDGDRITAIQSASTPLKSGIPVIPSAGKYVLPGLWDMHVHVTDESYLDLFVANGVTGVRDMGGGLDEPADGCESVQPSILQRWRAEVTAGKRIGPELVISGPVVSGTGWPSSLPARTHEEAVAAVRTLKRQRADFIKVYERIPLASYKVLATQANRNGLSFAGHVPEDVGLLKAISVGQRSIEHIRDPLLVCFTSDTSKLDRFFAEDQWGEEDKKWGRVTNAACQEIIAALQKNEVWLTPTLTVEKSKVSVEDPRHVNDERRRLLPQSVRSSYAAYVKGQLAQSAMERASRRLWWRTQQKLVQRMGGEGVRLLAGTDTACEGGLPGYSLHYELKELVDTGLSPLDALRAATIEPARYFNRRNEGAVVAGYRANLLLLDANPLDNIENTQRIRAVMLDGRLQTRTDLNKLLRRKR